MTNKNIKNMYIQAIKASGPKVNMKLPHKTKTTKINKRSQMTV